ncbi:unnamed protein product [Acanthoscelides obtectus]|uniref:Nbr1 FW domain-containing protein n=2 Tax=Acanthoscelides obtectus TaxID=200917 RepID=A0A9P0M262_ACAOB|nr:unnamed protein product [Acanthoscelides obtectus]CAK1625353.1 Next to BRCA1 gene 1 protein [Acanthoscelides obtectus]
MKKHLTLSENPKMNTKKKDLEIIYSLQWRTKPENGGSDKANIIGMYDIPSTTLNWEVFKSYLLKNSGTVGDDVKVSYITDSNREFPIESQTDFQIALYAFRRKARMGAIVNLKLDRISAEQSCMKKVRLSNDVETQFDNNEAVSLASTCCNFESPPEWFVSYMDQFKKTITEEVVASVTNIVSNIKPHAASQPLCYHSRKSKGESSKQRIRKLQPLIGDAGHDAKDLVKSLKLEGKVERKLKKLEHEAKKKEKKLAKLLKSSDSDVGGQSSGGRSRGERDDDDSSVLQMDAAPVKTQTSIPHMLGGEIYLHQWQVKNTGKLCWTSKTVLMFTWGSRALKPLESVVSVPYLQPGEIGLISVRLQIPNEPGQYECYWHFHHKERRFGHWLGCQVIVDPFDKKGHKSVLDTSPPIPSFNTAPQKFEEDYNLDQVMNQYSEIIQGPSTSEPVNNYTFNVNSEYNNIKNEPEEDVCDIGLDKQTYDKLVRDIGSRVDDIKLQDPTDTNCSSDSDNQSVISLSDSNDSKDLKEDYVMVPIPDCFKVDTPTSEFKEENVAGNSKQEDARASEGNTSPNCDDNNNGADIDLNFPEPSKKAESVSDTKSVSDSIKSDIVVVTLSNDDIQDEDFVYVIVDNQKLALPRKMIKSEYLKNAKEIPRSHCDILTRTNSATSSIETVCKDEKSDRHVQTAPSTSQATEVNFNIQKTEVAGNSENAQVEADFQECQEFSSHCSAAGTCFSEASAERNSRLFIFPQTCPGYEAIYPVGDLKEVDGAAIAPEYTWATSGKEETSHYAATSYAYTTPPVTTEQPSAPNEHTPNYQQTPPEERPKPPSFNTAPTSPTAGSRAGSENASTTNATPADKRAGVDRRDSKGSTSSRNTPPLHILPEMLVTGTLNAASSAISTARSVINRVLPTEVSI